MAKASSKDFGSQLRAKCCEESRDTEATGRKRTLGIPTVIDRMLQQALAQWLTPMYEPEFSKRSYGFRPNRNTHQAVLQAEQYLHQGKTWVIEVDLENFFDKGEP